MDVVQGFVLTAAAPCTGLCAERRKSLKPFGRGVYAKRVLRVLRYLFTGVTSHNSIWTSRPAGERPQARTATCMPQELGSRLTQPRGSPHALAPPPVAVLTSA